jgi:hypothetical protein
MSLRLCTRRAFENWPSWHIVYEWEDIISNQCDIKIHHLRKLTTPEKVINSLGLYPALEFADSKLRSHNFDLIFHLRPELRYGRLNDKNAIPIIIDFWQGIDLKKFYKVYRNCNHVFISSYENYLYLKENHCPLNISHLPLSLPDKYINLPENKSRDIEIIQPGRQNSVFESFMQKYLVKYPKLNYVKQVIHNSKIIYTSSIYGDMGEFATRESYFELLLRSKVGLYSSPGYDEGEKRTGSFNPVTPRLFEMMAAGCKILGRYPVNADFNFFGINNDLIPQAINYQQFESELDHCLSATNANHKEYKHFLSNHLTSTRIKKLQQALTGIINE